MLAIITNKFRIHNAKSFIEGFSELDGIEDPNDPLVSSIRQRSNIYLFIGKHTPWDPKDKISGSNDLTKWLFKRYKIKKLFRQEFAIIFFRGS